MFISSVKMSQGFTLIELMLSVLLGSIIFGVLLEIYLANNYFLSSVHALTSLQTNAIRASYLLKTFPLEQFEVRMTKRKDKEGNPIYSLYRLDHGEHKEMVEGISYMHYTNENKGVSIELGFKSIPFQTKYYIYLPY